MADAPPSDAYSGTKVIAVAILFAVLQILVVVLRFYARTLRKMKLGWDDYLMIPALLGGLGQCALYIVMVKVGKVGYHFEYVLEKWPTAVVALEKCLMVDEILDFPFSVTPAKLSILFFFQRIFGTQRFRYSLYVIGFLVIGTGLGTLFAAIFQCHPIAYTWDKTIEGGRCFNQVAYYRYVSVPNILTDVMILVLPIPAVWRLHTTVIQKIGLTGVFTLGSLGTVASCIRMSRFFQKDALVDPTWTSVSLGVWTLAEAGLLVIAACLPSLWPLFACAVPRTITKPTFGRAGGATPSPGCSAGNGSGSGGASTWSSRRASFAARWNLRGKNNHSGTHDSDPPNNGFARLGGDGKTEKAGDPPLSPRDWQGPGSDQKLDVTISGRGDEPDLEEARWAGDGGRKDSQGSGWGGNWGADGQSDEVPLNSIAVTREVELSTSRAGREA